MIGSDKSKMAEAIVSQIEPEPETVTAPEEESMDEGMLSASDDMMSALKINDAKGFAQALKAFLDMQGSSEEPEEKHAILG